VSLSENQEEDDRWGRSEEVFIPHQSPTKRSGPTDPRASALGRGGSAPRRFHVRVRRFRVVQDRKEFSSAGFLWLGLFEMLMEF
jgi:hypothetical protein